MKLSKKTAGSVYTLMGTGAPYVSHLPLPLQGKQGKRWDNNIQNTLEYIKKHWLVLLALLIAVFVIVVLFFPFNSKQFDTPAKAGLSEFSTAMLAGA